MRSKLLSIFLLTWCASLSFAQPSFKLVGTTEPEPGTSIIDVDYTGPKPADASPYLLPGNWKVRWSTTADSATTSVSVRSLSVDTETHKLRLELTGILPPAEEMVSKYWTVLFNPPDASPELPQVVSSTPSIAQKPAGVTKDCKNKQSDRKPFFCPPAAGQTPDVSFTGSFLAAGGTKPIYAFSVKGNLVSPKVVLGLNPGLAADIEINQNVQPPNNRTRFDPDSITAGLSFTRTIPVQKSRLYGINLQFGLPSGEFTRSDPSSNIIVSGMSSFVLNPWKLSGHKSAFVTLYPLLGFEAGHNLNKPTQISSVPVDLSNYNGIFRGLAGGDAVFGVASPDRTTNVFAITTTYRVRLPALDEPFEKTLHQITTVDLTTKARNWIQVEVTYAPWAFKYVALDAKYQYGSLPPLFNLVDHKFTLGLTLQAVQSRKPTIAPTLK